MTDADQSIQGWRYEASGEHWAAPRRLLFSLEGRMERSTYWLLAILPGVTLAAMVYVLDIATALGGMGIALLALLAAWVAFTVSVRRCHDRELPGWFLLIVLIPPIGVLLMLLELGVLRGTDGDNRHGADPLRTRHRGLAPLAMSPAEGA